MGIPMTTSSQAWTAPALHSDMHVVRVSSACWRRSSCSSPSDRLCCVRLSESGLVRRSYGVAYRRSSGSDENENQHKLLIWRQSVGSTIESIAFALMCNHKELQLGSYRAELFSFFLYMKRWNFHTKIDHQVRKKSFLVKDVLKLCCLTTRWSQITSQDIQFFFFL